MINNFINVVETLAIFPVVRDKSKLFAILLNYFPIKCTLHFHYHVVVEYDVTEGIIIHGANDRAHNPSYRLEVIVEGSEPVFTLEDSTLLHIGHCEVNTFGYRISAEICAVVCTAVIP